MIKQLKEKVISLWKLHNNPPEIALGVAIGVFISILPVYGLHTLLVILAAFLIRRANVIAMLVGTNISLPPTIPFITWAGYNIGRLMLGKKYPYIPCFTFKGLSYKGLMNFYYPLLLGSLVLAVICATVFYFLTLNFMNKRRKAKLGA
ncbi:MAG TPA: DUF2062 domain-containing protein [Candidatus Margulisiibacteriota bacterium]|nr:DUF2062 domain-containing protein [Candidatus Margulisiibacteriota bacterium]